MQRAFRFKFGSLALLLQAAFIVLFATLGEYDESAKPKASKDAAEKADLNRIYPPFQDVNAMIFCGFGFLMTFMKKYGYFAVSINMFIAALLIQWAMIIRGFVYHGVFVGGKFIVSVDEMVAGDFASATVLISFGAVLGKTSPLQLLIMGMIEVVIAQINGWICKKQFHAADVGESMFIHAFGAYFGLAISRVLYEKNVKHVQEKAGSNYQSDIFSMIGTVFLWLYWPSFNGGGAKYDEMHRAYINTFLSLCACTVVTFGLCALYNKKGKLTMEYVQNATIAGGVAAGTTAHMPLEPYGAILLGSVAGFISVTGFRFIKEFLWEKVHIHDSCGVNNLHGMPAILAAIAGGVMGALAKFDDWGMSVYEIFPAMVPKNGTEFISLRDQYAKDYGGAELSPGLGWTGVQQGGYQILSIVVTVGIAITSGILTGLLLKIPLLDQVSDGSELFEDFVFWNLPEEDSNAAIRDEKIGYSLSVLPSERVLNSTDNKGTSSLANIRL